MTREEAGSVTYFVIWPDVSPWETGSVMYFVTWPDISPWERLAALVINAENVVWFLHLLRKSAL